MIVSVLPDGSVQHTLQDSAFIPFAGNRRSIKRMSEVLFDESAQQFFVHFIQGFCKDGDTKTAEENRVWLNARIRHVSFADYKKAVEFEIETVEDLRKAGNFFISD